MTSDAHSTSRAIDRRRHRRRSLRARVGLASLATVAVLAATASLHDASAAYTATTANAGNSWGASTRGTNLLAAGEPTAGQVGTIDLSTYWSPAATSLSSTTPAFTSVAVSYLAGCAVAGRLWCWGKNNNLGLGFADGLDRRLPTQVGSATNWATVSMSNLHTCATRTDGTLWCWGTNYSGQQGAPSPSLVYTPAQVGALTTWASVSTGSSGFTCARKTDGTLWCAGANASGQSGNGSTSPTNVTTFTQVGSGTNWASVDAGFSHVCATRTDGTLWCWGDNTNGPIGNGGTSGTVTSPTQVGGATDWAKVGAGTRTTCAIKTTGTLWCWGQNTFGEVGNGSTASAVTSPTQVGSATTWTNVAVGDYHTCGRRSDNTVWCWGKNADGQLGNGTRTDSSVPVQVSSAGSALLDAGGANSCSIGTNGVLSCWGSSLNQGNGADIAQNTFGAVASRRWTTAELSSTGGCAIRGDATLWCWGTNPYGQVGNGTTLVWSVPQQVGSSTYLSVAAGSQHTCAIRTDRTLWCWGSSVDGQVGLGSISIWTTPQQVGSATDWVAVSATYSTTCGIRSGGTMWCWGQNSYGQQGTGSTASQVLAPQAAAGGGAVWAKVAVGLTHTCGVRTNGTLWCWGGDSSSQLGDGGTTQQNSPIQVGAATDWTEVTAGGLFTCGIRATGGGTLYCWGSNASGQLGMGAGDTTTRTTPTAVPTGGPWLDVDGGSIYTCGVRTTGALRCWGDNTYGQLGDGTQVSHGDTGADVSGVSGAIQASAGNVASAVITS